VPCMTGTEHKLGHESMKFALKLQQNLSANTCQQSASVKTEDKKGKKGT
jgi:hypothetical protein